LSYYSDQAICRRLGIEPATLAAARLHLQKADLIAYQKPLYQVLSLEDPSSPISSLIRSRSTRCCPWTIPPSRPRRRHPRGPEKFSRLPRSSPVL
jgi:hypothetical protein